MDTRGGTVWGHIDARDAWMGLVVSSYLALVTVVAAAIAAAAALLAGPVLDFQMLVWRSVFGWPGPEVAISGGWLTGRIAPEMWAWSILVGVVVFVTALAQVGLAARGQSTRLLLWRMQARVARSGELPETPSALYDMAIAMGQSASPALYVTDGPGVNAAVLGDAVDRCVVVVTPGFGELPEGHQRAALGSLLARLRYERMPALLLLSALLVPIARLNALDRLFSYLASMFQDTDLRSALKMGAFLLVVVFTFTEPLVLFFAFPMGLVMLVASLVAWLADQTAYAAHVRLAEFGDAEGMMLLKDPEAMLEGLDDITSLDNEVWGAETSALLFYCWPKPPPPLDRKPEMSRVDHLRELLGADGLSVMGAGGA